MQQDLIILSEYCTQGNIEPSFIRLLEEEGMIHIIIQEGEPYLYSSELNDVERFSRMYYDLSINMAGIDAINHLLKRVTRMQSEISTLKKLLQIHESNTTESPPDLS
ncbi:MAG: chaperone modulator CbpM [Tannerellaceae bacterium]|nr:chaperone modulator CbpM [Tannerellaceae bacterium]